MLNDDVIESRFSVVSALAARYYPGMRGPQDMEEIEKACQMCNFPIDLFMDETGRFESYIKFVEKFRGVA